MKWLVIFIVLVFLIGNVFADFETDSSFLKRVIKSNGSFQEQIKILNNEELSFFEIRYPGLENFVTLDEESFDLDFGEEKNLKMVFSNKND